MERVLALDVGTVRIGVAISDPLQIFPSITRVVLRKKNPVEEINWLIEQYKIKKHKRRKMR